MQSLSAFHSQTGGLPGVTVSSSASHRAPGPRKLHAAGSQPAHARLRGTLLGWGSGRSTPQGAAGWAGGALMRRATEGRRPIECKSGVSLEYVEPVFRPPAEWQVTNGCSWNRCTFCEMYTQPQKRFSVKPLAEVEVELAQLARTMEGGPMPARMFLADGDAMTLPFPHLKALLQLVRQHLPSVRRVSSYCLPRNLQNKTKEQLAELKTLGLSILYIGCESGDDEVLRRVNKGETFASSAAALQLIHAAGIKTSVMILNGLGGAELSEQHAVNSARLMNEVQPNYLSTLVVSFPLGIERYEAGWRDATGADSAAEPFEELSQAGLFAEMRTLLTYLELDKTIFRSDHASNYLVLKGVLGRDKAKLLAQVELAMEDPAGVNLRQEWMRGL